MYHNSEISIITLLFRLQGLVSESVDDFSTSNGIGSIGKSGIGTPLTHLSSYVISGCTK